MVTTYNTALLYVIYLNSYYTNIFDISSFITIDNYRLKALSFVLTITIFIGLLPLKIVIILIESFIINLLIHFIFKFIIVIIKKFIDIPPMIKDLFYDDNGTSKIMFVSRFHDDYIPDEEEEDGISESLFHGVSEKLSWVYKHPCSLDKSPWYSKVYAKYTIHLEEINKDSQKGTIFVTLYRSLRSLWTTF